MRLQRLILVTIEVDTETPTLCSENCEWLDAHVMCRLYASPLRYKEGLRRCNSCVVQFEEHRWGP